MTFRWQRSIYFNPRSREGSDRSYYVDAALTKEISIHAPVKEATPHGHDLTTHPDLFQSTLP